MLVVFAGRVDLLRGAAILFIAPRIAAVDDDVRASQFTFAIQALMHCSHTPIAADSR